MGIEKYESEALNKLLEEFYAIFVRKTGKITSVISFVYYCCRPIPKRQRVQNLIVRDGEFENSNQNLGENPDYLRTRKREAAEPGSHDTKKKHRGKQSAFC